MMVNMSRKKEGDKDYWILGGICAVIGLCVIISAKNFDDIKGGFFLLGIGLVFMAATSEEFRKKLFDFFLSIFKGLYKLIRR